MKYLPRKTPAALFEIQKPIWNGGKAAVGLKEDRIAKHNQVEIGYIRKKDGKKSYPDTYYFDGDQRDNYPRQVWGSVKLVIIPINDLEILTRQKPKRIEPELEYLKREDIPQELDIFFSEDKNSAQLTLF